MSRTVVLTIGLHSNVTLSALPYPAARRFVSDVRRLLLLAGAEVFVDAAESSGRWTDERTGRVVTEESRTWVASVEDDAVHVIANALPELCDRYEQDAIALTTGGTDLVSA